MKYVFSFLFSLAVLGGFFDFASASTLKIGSDIQVLDSESIQDNLYILGGTTKFDSKTLDDLVTLHGNGTISGEVFGDVVIIGGTTNISGIIHGDVRIFGGSVVVNSRIDGDLVVIAGNVTLEKGSAIIGDVLIMSGSAYLKGEIDGSLSGLINKIEISGEILEDSKVTSNNLTIKDDAYIAGELTYFSPTNAVVDQGAEISKPIKFNQVDSWREQDIVERTFVGFISFWKVLRFISTLFFALILVHVFRVFSKDVTDYILSSFFRSFAIGLISIVAIPLAAFILLISIVAFPIGIVMIALYTVAMMISTTVAGMYLGVILKRISKKGEQGVVTFASTAVALFIITLLQFIPIFGEIVRILVSITALGGISVIVYRSIRFHGKKIKI